ncbi:MAG: ArsR family transcriptional regulator [Deltaproteobacteria bacterium]|jgi:DNA-binding transcriptional ArsR family regulator|nr:ArsR family transcriptional regulator [Deltaproteobacteria bacterium]
MNRAVIKTPPEDLEQVAMLFDALGNATRQKIILMHEPGEELSIKEIADQFDLGRTTVVHHITVLFNNGVLRLRKCGRQRLYSVNYEAIWEGLQKMRFYIANVMAGRGNSEPSILADEEPDEDTPTDFLLKPIGGCRDGFHSKDAAQRQP